jgi:hypothetical protein
MLIKPSKTIYTLNIGVTNSSTRGFNYRLLKRSFVAMITQLMDYERLRRKHRFHPTTIVHGGAQYG